MQRDSDGVVVVVFVSLAALVAIEAIGWLRRGWEDQGRSFNWVSDKTGSGVGKRQEILTEVAVEVT